MLDPSYVSRNIERSAELLVVATACCTRWTVAEVCFLPSINLRIELFLLHEAQELGRREQRNVFASVIARLEKAYVVRAGPSQPAGEGCRCDQHKKSQCDATRHDKTQSQHKRPARNDLGRAVQLAIASRIVVQSVA